MSGKQKLLTSQLEKVGIVQAHVMSNELASKVKESYDNDEMLSGENNFVHHVYVKRLTQ